MLTCARPSGVWGLSRDTGELRQFSCGSPRCEACAPRWGRMLRARLARVLPQMVRPAWRGTPLKFGTFTLPPEIDAGRPSLSVVEADSVACRRFRRFFSAADPQSRVFVWKREVGTRGARRLHRHVAIVTRLSNIALKRLAWRAGYGRVVNFKLATAARYRTIWPSTWPNPALGLMRGHRARAGHRPSLVRCRAKFHAAHLSRGYGLSQRFLVLLPSARCSRASMLSCAGLARRRPKASPRMARFGRHSKMMLGHRARRPQRSERSPTGITAKPAEDRSPLCQKAY